MLRVARPDAGFQSEVLGAMSAFWDGLDVRHLHHPVWFRQFSEDGLVARTSDGELAGYLLAHCTRSLAYVHVVAVKPEQRGGGLGRVSYWGA